MSDKSKAEKQRKISEILRTMCTQDTLIASVYDDSAFPDMAFFLFYSAKTEQFTLCGTDGFSFANKSFQAHQAPVHRSAPSFRSRKLTYPSHSDDRFYKVSKKDDLMICLKRMEIESLLRQFKARFEKNKNNPKLTP